MDTKTSATIKKTAKADNKKTTFYLRPAILDSFKCYSWKMFANDAMAGLMVAIVALPMSIALGIQSNATLQQGMITAIIAGFFISFMGGSRVQIGGSTATFVAIVAGYVADPEIGMLGMQMATLMAGVIMMIMGVGRAGLLIKYIPFPIVIGFTSGIGIVLMTGQIKDFLGMSFTSGTSFISKITGIFTSLGTINIATMLIGFLTLMLIVFLPKWKKKLPASFIAIALATIITAIIGAFRVDRFGIATIGSTFGDVKAEIYFPQFSAIANLNFAKLILPAITLAMLASIESLLSATIADGMIGTKHNPHSELLAQGFANVACALFGGLPATGAIARTATNIKNGGKTPLAGILHAFILLIMFYLLMPLMKFIPMTSLGAVLIVVSVSMSNFKLFVRLALFNIKDTLVLLTTFFLTIFKDLGWGIIGGMSVAVLAMIVELLTRTKIERQHDIRQYLHCLFAIGNIDKETYDCLLQETQIKESEEIAGVVDKVESNSILGDLKSTLQDNEDITKVKDVSAATESITDKNSDTAKDKNSDKATHLTASDAVASGCSENKEVTKIGKESIDTSASCLYESLAKNVAVYKLSQKLCFKSADRIVATCAKDMGEAKVVIIDIREVHSFDVTALERLTKFKLSLEREGKTLVMFGEKPKLLIDFRKAVGHIKQ